jgi:uncharacterized protein YqeY
MREAISEQLKSALKAGDKSRVSTLRMLQAAIKDRDIANRGAAKGAAGDDEILQILGRMVKQRQESERAFQEGGRPELARQERSEIAILEEFLPSRMDDEEARQAIARIIAEVGAQGPRDMGRVMSALKDRFTGRMDFSRASGIVKDVLR